MKGQVVSSPEMPCWVRDWLDGREWRDVIDRPDLTIRVCEHRGWRMLRAVARRVRTMSADHMRRAVADAYRAVHTFLCDSDTPHPVRVWNYLPGINDECAPGLDRYMIFSAGRHDAFVEWFGQEDLGRLVPAASAVGSASDDLVIDVLAAAERGHAIENTRQIPAYRYSQRYGPLPPCFSRAVVLSNAPMFGGSPVALLSGTASVVGEATVHPESLDAQLRETFENLNVLIAGAVEYTARAATEARDLARLRDVRVYLPATSAAQADRIVAAVHDRAPMSRHVQIVNAGLCRPDLLVEIEGVADMSPTGLADGPRSRRASTRPSNESASSTPR